MPSIAELAERYSARLAGKGNRLVSGLAPLTQANDSQLAFLANPLYRNDALISQAAGLIVSEADHAFLQEHSADKNRTYLVTKRMASL